MITSSPLGLDSDILKYKDRYICRHVVSKGSGPIMMKVLLIFACLKGTALSSILPSWEFFGQTPFCRKFTL